MGRKDRAWILSDLEAMAVDLGTILDVLGAHADEWTVGELKRLGVLTLAVADGARAVARAGTPWSASPSMYAPVKYADLHG